MRVLDGNSTTARVLGLEVVPELMRVLTIDVDKFDVVFAKENVDSLKQDTSLNAS